MKLFVIHRFNDKKKAKATLKSIAKSISFDITPIFLDSSGRDSWKSKAEAEIDQSEAVIVFDRRACEESENAKWEMDKAAFKNKVVVYLELNNNASAISKLKSLYDFEEEFSGCFASGSDDNFDLYKLMIDSSESLIQRRQKTNAFFITAIGSLLAIAGLLVKTGSISGESIGILYGFSFVGLLLCNSWRNLIDNYGKLNKAKFDVILRLEKSLGSQIYSAEWVALGKGLRPNKYKSFTATEKNVPSYFGVLFFALIFFTAAWQICG